MVLASIIHFTFSLIIVAMIESFRGLILAQTRKSDYAIVNSIPK